jgi:hypothetical protein
MSAPVDTQLLTDVTEAARHHACLYSQSYLTQAAALLGDLLKAGQKHGVEPDRWGAVANLPGAVVDVIGYQDRYHKPPQTGEAAVALLHQVADALAERWNVDVEWPGELLIALPRVDTSPSLGPSGTGQLAINVHPDGGWMFTYHDPSQLGGLTVGRNVYAPFDAAGAAEVAEIAVQVNQDPKNPFPCR